MIPRNKIFVGSLPPSTKPEEIRRLFENYGVVTECDVMNRCAFVHMQSPDMAENAIQALHNSNFKGVTINVEHGRSKERSNQSGGSGEGRGRGSGRGGSRGGQQGGDGFRDQNRSNYNDGGDRSGGPMRKNSNRGNFRSQPYQGGPSRGNDFDRQNQSGGSSRGGFNRGGGRGNDFNDRNSGGRGGFNGGGSRFSGGQQFNSEDRRGFALPNDGAGGGHFGGRGAGHVSLAISAQNDPFTRRSAVDSGGMQSGYSNRGGFSQGNGTGNYQASNYNQAFPPLGSEPGRTNRGPPPSQSKPWMQ
ncbi:cold-inducible RNA-binding protein B [Toxorhynchites rutilus septentrionalis]|uniref:cold-inducible RNA-binding protein B n=1 Tax=Toxorhynchites rutilus septentrionalis TaxID=329112 RepID=UPI00247868A0|nr:cold-inducible RNA-binding protein B [Toxorhynchites rutilus septentrionalis]